MSQFQCLEGYDQKSNVLKKIVTTPMYRRIWLELQCLERCAQNSNERNDIDRIPLI